MKHPISELVVRRMYQQYVTDRDRTLLDLVFNATPTQPLLDETLAVCDIEELGSHKALLFSYFMRAHPELHFSSYTEPRLKGLFDFYRFANTKTLSHFSKIGKALNAKNIPTLIFKGAAMKTLRPALSRPMGDVDILIPAKHLPEAVSLCTRLGYRDAMTGLNTAVDIHTANNESAVDIHTAIFSAAGKADQFHNGLFSRAKTVKAFGVEVLLPSHEDLFFIVLGNLTKNLRGKTSIHGLFYALLDAQFLLSDKPGFSWGIVRANIGMTDMELPVRFAAEFMNCLVPGIVPDIDTHLPLSPAMEAYCNQIIFDEDHFLKRQAYCQAIRVVELKNYPAHYGKILVKFLLLKKLRKFPAFVRWYLKRKELQGLHSANR